MNIKTDKILKAAVYCRVSTEKTDQINSLENQQSFFQDLIDSDPMLELYKIYVDEGISGTNTKNRQAFNNMLKDAECGCFDVIITKEVSRFARNTLDTLVYTRKLKEFGVGVVFLNDSINTLESDGELRLVIMASIAQEESRKTSERVKWGQKRQMEAGVVFGCDMLGYDVRDGNIYINQEGADIVRRIFHMYVNEHKGTSTIARELALDGVPSFTCTKWTQTTIIRILHNEKYCGDLIQKKTITPNYLTHESKRNKGEEEFIVIKNHHEPIISRELFERAQDELNFRSVIKNKNARIGRKRCFSSKIVCGECGKSYIFHDKVAPNGKKRKTWECYNKKKNGVTIRYDEITGEQFGCNSKTIMDNDLQELMYMIIEKVANDKAYWQSIVESKIREMFEMCPYNIYEKKQKQYEELLYKKEKLLNQYMDSNMTREKYEIQNSEITDQLLEIKEELLELEKIKDVEIDLESVVLDSKVFMGEMIDNASLTEEYIKEILDEMTIHKDKSKIVKLNFIPYKWKKIINYIRKNDSACSRFVLMELENTKIIL